MGFSPSHIAFVLVDTEGSTRNKFYPIFSPCFSSFLFFLSSNIGKEKVSFSKASIAAGEYAVF